MKWYESEVERETVYTIRKNKFNFARSDLYLTLINKVYHYIPYLQSRP